MEPNTYLYLNSDGEHCFYRRLKGEKVTFSGEYSSPEALMANMRQARFVVRGPFRIVSGVPDQFKNDPKFKPMDEVAVKQVVNALRDNRPILHNGTHSH